MYTEWSKNNKRKKQTSKSSMTILQNMNKKVAKSSKLLSDFKMRTRTGTFAAQREIMLTLFISMEVTPLLSSFKRISDLNTTIQHT